MIAQHIKTMKQVHRERSLATQREEEYLRPKLKDLSRINLLYERFQQECKPECKDNASIFVLIIVLLYCPSSFISEKIARNGVRSRIASVLGVSNSLVTKRFNDARFLIMCHPEFKTEANRVYQSIAPQ